MSTTVHAPPMIQAKAPSSLHMILTLGGVALFSGFLIVSTFKATEGRIADNKRRLLERSVFITLPSATTRQTFAIDGGQISKLEGGDPAARKIYAGYDDSGALVGVAIEAAGQGYQDVVRVLYGYSPAKERIIGFTVLESKETPGLGDRIAKDPKFLVNFEAMDVALDEEQSGLLHSIEVVKHGAKDEDWEIDGITGATISSVAVGKMIDKSAKELLPLIVKHVAELEAGYEQPEPEAGSS